MRNDIALSSSHASCCLSSYTSVSWHAPGSPAPPAAAAPPACSSRRAACGSGSAVYLDQSVQVQPALARHAPLSLLAALHANQPSMVEPGQGAASMRRARTYAAGTWHLGSCASFHSHLSTPLELHCHLWVAVAQVAFICSMRASMASHPPPPGAAAGAAVAWAAAAATKSARPSAAARIMPAIELRRGVFNVRSADSRRLLVLFLESTAPKGSRSYTNSNAKYIA
ncbi:MAG: hypothetical protein J3K34DRAFT_419767 [Monoraphidium minutum]|nr:MAG: hypothetical protein J3K34DRAFT_419767 [Monoraphidium minutum]